MFKIKKFNLLAKRELPMPSGNLTSKEGYFVEWNQQIAELSPLQGLSKENLEDCLSELKEYEELFLSIPAKFIPNYTLPLFGLSSSTPKNNTVLFCLESLLYQKYNQKKQVKIRVNALVRSGDLEGFSNFYNKGYRTFKIKIGRTDTISDIHFLNEIQKICPEPIKLRLDANQRLSQNDVFRYLDSSTLKLIEYFEEPFSEIDTYNNCSVPFALDENNLKFKNVMKNEFFKGNVVKPSLTKSISGVFHMAKELNITSGHPKNLILSSSYETLTGLKILVLLAAELNEIYGQVTHGLDGMDYFFCESDPELSISGELLSLHLS